MEGTWQTSLLTALAPAAWGSSYVVTAHFLPADRPLFGATVRALPVGLLLVALTRRLPSGAWWWKALILGTLNIGGFFALIFVVAQRLPSGLAATMMATSPAVMMLLAWPLLGERPRPLAATGALAGFAGVALMVLGDGQRVDAVGVAASLTAMAMASLGFILGKRWRPPVPLLAFTAWQLLAGGLVLAPVALVVEGPPPALDARAVGGFLYVCLVATALAYAVWFRGLQRLEAGTVALIGLLNPVVGLALGVLVAHERFGPAQALGVAVVLGGILLGQPSVAGRLRRRGRRTRRRRCRDLAVSADFARLD